MTKRKIEYWVIPPDQDAEFVACMEEVLETYAAAYDPRVLARSSSGIFPRRFVRGLLGTHEQPSERNRERLAGGAGGGNERPCSPARCRRNPPTDGSLTPPRPTTRRASRGPRAPRPANVGSESSARRHTPRRGPAGHLLPPAPGPNGAAMCCSA